LAVAGKVEMVQRGSSNGDNGEERGGILRGITGEFGFGFGK